MLVAAFEDRAEADGAVRALDRAGLGRAVVREERVAPSDGCTGAPTTGDADAAARSGSAAAGKGAIGAVIGAVSGFLLVLLLGPTGGSSC